MLADLSMCQETDAVRQFCVEAYGRGALATAKTTDFEGSTSVFSKRRYRDRWNGIVVRRLARYSKQTLKVHSRCKSRFERGGDYHPDPTFQRIKRSQKPKALWTLQMAGDWSQDTERCARQNRKMHLMRVMLLSVSYTHLTLPTIYSV